MERMLHELVKLVHVDMRKKLGCQIAQRQSRAGCGTLKTSDHALKEPKNIVVRDIPAKNTQ